MLASDTAPSALFVPELVFRVLEELPAADLISTTLVCAAWTWGATDILWRRHPVKLSSLLSKLPPFEGRDTGSLKDEKTTITLTRQLEAITHEEWSEFTTRYAHKVKQLVIDHHILPAFANHFPKRIRQAGPICPHITSIHFLRESETSGNATEIAAWALGLALISPPPTVVDISSWMTPDDAVRWLWEEESGRARSITIARFDSHHSHLSYAKFSALRKMTFQGHMDLPAWKNLAMGCPLLQDLDVTVVYGAYGADISSPVTFLALLAFSFAFKDDRNPQNGDILRLCVLYTEMPALRSFKLLSSYGSTSGESIEVGRWLAGMEALEHVEMTDDDPNALHDVLPQLPPLLTFSFQSPWGFPFVMDSDWEALGRTQTRLKELVIQQTPREYRYPAGGSSALRDLVNFASHLRNETLERLAMGSLKISSHFGTHGSGPSPFPTFRSLRTLTFQQIEISEGMEVVFVTFLANLCPNLRFLGIESVWIQGEGGHRASASSASLEAAFWEMRANVAHLAL
ncbi:hypothetical protein FRB96_004320 [Tulasnella sp. 330]|nr:hypothetical protein FRB96_004320 [Tulasnella sp. 330]